MTDFLWTIDVPSGVLRNHTLSSKIRYAAIARCKFHQFVKTEPGFGRKKGDTINIVKFRNITVPTTAIISEDNLIPEDVQAVGYTPITVQEFGRSVPFTSFAEDLSTFDIEKGIQKKLRDQMAIALDVLAALAFKQTYVIATPTALGTITWQTNSATPTNAATVNINCAHMGIIRDYMMDTLWTPPYEGEDYAGILETKALRGIKSDPDFMFWRHYLKPEQAFFESEVGKIENIRCVESNNTAALVNAFTTGSMLGEGVIFGDEAVAQVEVETPELRAAIPGDFGRKKAVAWYGILQDGIIWNATSTAGEAKIVHIAST